MITSDERHSVGLEHGRLANCFVAGRGHCPLPHRARVRRLHKPQPVVTHIYIFFEVNTEGCWLLILLYN
jgi:hypothetical protein